MSDIETWWTHKNNLYPARVHPNQKRIVFYDHYISVIEEEQALRDSYGLLWQEHEKLQAKVDELESMNEYVESLQSIKNKWQAEGIRKMIVENGTLLMGDIECLDAEDAYAYADNLEKGDE